MTATTICQATYDIIHVFSSLARSVGKHASLRVTLRVLGSKSATSHGIRNPETQLPWNEEFGVI